MIQGRKIWPSGSHFYLFSLALLSFSSAVSAQSLLRVSNLNVSDPTLLEALSLDSSLIESGYSAELSNQTSSAYLERLGNAVGFTQAGLSADYGTPYTHFILSASAGLGYQKGYAGVGEILAGQESLDELGAFSAQAQMTLGFHFHKEQRSRYYLSFASSSFSKNSLELESWGWGFLWQYDLVSARSLGGPLVKWQGLRLGTGLRWNNFRSEFSHKMSDTSVAFTTPAAGGMAPMTLGLTASATGRLRSEADILSFPLEVGTAFQWFQVITLYGVAGIDANTGIVKGSIRADGPVKVTQKQEVDGKMKTVEVAKADVEYYSYKEAKPEVFTLRALLGLQFDLGRGSVFLQYQRGSLEGSEAAALGFRSFY